MISITLMLSSDDTFGRLWNRQVIFRNQTFKEDRIKINEYCLFVGLFFK